MIHSIQTNKGSIYRSGRLDTSVIKLLDIKTLICLESNRDHILQELNFCAYNSRLLFYHYPLHWFKRPKAKTLIEIAKCLHTAEKPTLIHCRLGVDRTGYVIASYRMKYQGWTFDEAWAECIERGHRYHKLFWWKKSLEQVQYVS